MHNTLRTFSFVVLSAFMLLSPLNCSAQEPKVLAPHEPIAPRMPDQAPPADSYVPRYLRGGFWMTDAYTKSSVYVRNDVQTSPVTVTPILYLSNGVKLSLSPVTLQPAGTAVININDSLTGQGIAPYASLSGYIELQYVWPWDALCATVSSIDATHSVIFTYGLSALPPSPARGRHGMKPVQPGSGEQTLEGAWWKQEDGVTGFVALSNTTEQPLSATVQVTDAGARPLGSYVLTISPHGTKSADLQELTSVANSLGGLQVTFTGAPDALIVNGGLEDQSKGYSASIPFGPPPPASAKASTLSYAEIGLMAGAADPMMHFPAGTVFTPYSVVRNIGAQPVTITPTLYWMEGGAARSATQASFSLPPLHTKSLDVMSLVALSGLKNFNGTLNLILEVQGPQGSVLLSSGSVDQNYTYVFEVVPRGVKESGSKNLSYWSTGNGDDTMVTLWNPADEAQDFIFTVFFSGGHYLLPIHLGPRATQVFNLSAVIEAQIPDREGNLIPPAVHEGSAQISGTQAENELILVAMDAGTYNVRKATCAYRCVNCNGAVSWALLTVPFAVRVAGSTQLTLQDTWNNGVHHNVTSGSTWNSSATSVATVSSGLVQGVGAGSVTIDGFAPNDPWAEQVCGSPVPSCPQDFGGDGSGPGDVVVVTFSPNPASIPAGGVRTITATVTGNSNNTAITLALSSSGSGVAAFTNGSPDPSHLTITSSTNLSIKGIQGSTTPGDVTLTATISGADGTQTVGSSSITVVAVSVKFQSSSGSSLPSPLRIGISSTVNDCNNNAVTHDRTQTIQAVVSPAWETPNIDISQNSGTNGGTLSLNVTNTDDSTGIITFTVVGTARSSNPSDVGIVATDTEVGTQFTQPVSVIVPYQIATPHPQPSQSVPGQNIAISACKSPAAVGIGSNDELITDYEIYMSITVWDQFGTAAGDLYSGALITETYQSSNIPINQTLTSSSTYTDPFGPVYIAVASLSPSDPRVAAWPSQPLGPFPITSSTPSTPVQVDGFSIGTISTRTWTSTSPNTVSVTWP